MLVDQNRIQGKDVLVRLKTVIMRPNLHDIHNIPILAGEWGAEGVEYQALTPIYYSDQLGNENWHVNNDLWVNSLADLQNALIRIKELKTLGYPVLNTNENLDLIFRYFSDPIGQKQKVWSHHYRKKSQGCRSWMGLQILPDGGMKMCHWMEPFQNIRDGNLRSGWNIRPHCWKKKCDYLEK
jgi:MoaA/NifB/PqqE/SkfB family radical SAM enzyme